MRPFAGVRVCWVLVLLGLRVGSLWAQNENPSNPSWSDYHSTERAYALMEGWSREFPQLTRLYSIGETLKGTPLLVLEITNKETGDAAGKPGYYYDGNIHAGELAAAEVALHFAWHVLTNYGVDPRITRLLDTRTLYIRPKFNPDGADIALTSEQNLRSTPRPYDEDRDGLLDEDPGNDLDGDGSITQMRVRSATGPWKVSAANPRVMERRGEDDVSGEFYELYSEGLDDDGDGRFNEDGIGGIDMNRNFPRNWGLEFEQRGAGPFPLSEPETRATLEFLNAHRNITGVFHGHTAGGFLYRLPSTTSWDEYDLSDQNLILELSRKYEVTTGQRAVPSYSDPRVHRYGTLISWGYWDFGVVGFVPEFWGGFGRDYDGDGAITEAERHRWDAEELDGEGFAAWAPYDHPQLGPIEIGGWRRKFTAQNPPPHLLKGELELYVPWMLWLAEISPRIVLGDVEAAPLGSGLFKLTATVENEGYLPTYITRRALEAEIAVPVRVELELTNAELVTGTQRTDIGHLGGVRYSRGSAAESATRRMVEYVVRVTGENPRLSIIVRSEKGGLVRQEVPLRTGG
ncbi:MAG: M14 family metallopeptidase [Gemmatimonadales bacterium]|jgi:hypothetical protein